MAHTFWRGEHIVYRRGDYAADVYAWDAASGSYKWEADFDTPEQAHRYIEDVEALPEFPSLKPITTPVAKQKAA